MSWPGWLPRAERTTIAGFGILLCGGYLLVVRQITAVEFGGFVALAAPFLGITEHAAIPTVQTKAGEAVVTAPVAPAPLFGPAIPPSPVRKDIP